MTVLHLCLDLYGKHFNPRIFLPKLVGDFKDDMEEAEDSKHISVAIEHPLGRVPWTHREAYEKWFADFLVRNHKALSDDSIEQIALFYTFHCFKGETFSWDFPISKWKSLIPHGKEFDIAFDVYHVEDDEEQQTWRAEIVRAWS